MTRRTRPTGPTPPHGAPGAAGDPPAHDWRPRARAAALASALAAAVLVLVPVAVVRTWDDLPDPVASHWGATGGPDGFTSLSALLVGVTVLAVVLVAGFALLARYLGRTASTLRLLVGTTVWLAGLLGTLLVGTLAGQRGLEDATQAPAIGPVLALALLVPLVPAVLAGLLVPADPPQPTEAPVPADAPRAGGLRPGERTAWFGRASGRAGLWIGGGAVVVTTVVVVVTQLWAMMLLPLLLGVLLAATTVFDVRVDGTGLTVRSVLGLPRTHVPLDEVERADVVEVSPLGDFGGWGWRVGREGRTGVVLRSGTALEVTRTGGRRFVVTLDDAHGAAATLNTLADVRRRGGATVD